MATASGTARELIPDTTSLAALRRAAAGCTACPLWRCGTQTVFGEGRRRAAMMLVGEQPGDKEDLAGKPFVGPAGQLLDRALEEAGIAREDAYVTNAVKHFKWKPKAPGESTTGRTSARSWPATRGWRPSSTRSRRRSWWRWAPRPRGRCSGRASG